MIDRVISYLKKFFEISDPKSYVEFRVFDKRGAILQFFFKIEDLMNESIILKKEIEKYLRGYNFYFGVLPRKEEKGTKEAIIEGATLWLDFDVHELEKPNIIEVKKKYEEFIKKLNEIGFIFPNFVLFSGKGFQCYWFLDTKLKKDELEKLEEALLEKLSSLFPNNIDKQVKDVSRIMRVPLSQNVKYEQPIQTEVWEYRPIRYPTKYLKDFIISTSLEKKESEKPVEIKEDKFVRKLNEKVREKIVRFFYNFWVVGYRNSLEIYLAGLLIKNGVKFEHAYNILKRICELSKDEEISARLKNLEYHYKNRVALEEKLKGLSGISDTIWEIINRDYDEQFLSDRPELRKLIEMRKQGILIKDDVEAYVRNVFNLLHLTRNIFKEEYVKTFSLNELMKIAAEEVEYIVENLVPARSLIIIGGKPESFKSIFSLILGVCVARGTNFLKFKTKKSRVLYVDAENGEKIISQRLKYFFDGGLEDADFVYFYYTNPEDLKKLLAQQKFDLVIFDSMRRFLKGSETESDVINNFFRGFLKPLRDSGATIILIHHFRKKRGDVTDEELIELFRGSSDIVAMVDMAFALELQERVSDVNEGISRFVVGFRVAKNRLGVPINDFSFLVEKNDKLKKSTIDFREFKVYLTIEERMRDAVLDILASGNEMKRVEIKEALIQRGFEVNERVLSNVLTSLVRVGRIIKTKRGVYRISNFGIWKEFVGESGGGSDKRVEEN